MVVRFSRIGHTMCAAGAANVRFGRICHVWSELVTAYVRISRIGHPWGGVCGAWLSDSPESVNQAIGHRRMHNSHKEAGK